MEVPAMAISSTDIRERSANHMPVWYLVPDGVVQYINKYDLYHATAYTAEDLPHYSDGLPHGAHELRSGE